MFVYVNRMEGENNENVYERFDVSVRGEGMNCMVVVVLVVVKQHLQRV